ncbi:unnamed protein product [Phytomonas sp. Hart1]|nr:unnamed protein product [Phytomonas sp. Hart1]|eukprot:CCW71885.1 unnamed protein product [Phytomonas sp. isolate Hart1]
MPSTGITPLGPLYRSQPFHPTHRSPTPPTANGDTGRDGPPPTSPPSSILQPHPSYWNSYRAAPLAASPGGAFDPNSPPPAPERARKSTAAAEAAQLRAQVRLLEREVHELRQGLAQNAAMGRRPSQPGGIGGIPATPRPRSAPKARPAIVFNRRVVDPFLEIRNGPIAQAKPCGSRREGWGPTGGKAGRQFESKPPPSAPPAAATWKRADRAVVEVPLFAHSPEMPPQGQTLLPNSSASCQAVNEPQLPTPHNAPEVSFSPLSLTSNKDPNTQSTDVKAPLTTGAEAPGKSSTMLHPSGTWSSLAYPTQPASEAGAILEPPPPSAPGEIAAAVKVDPVPLSSAHQTALQYLVHELAESREQLTAMRRTAEEQNGLRAQHELRLNALTAEVAQLKSQLKAAQDEIGALLQRPHTHTTTTTNGGSIGNEVQPLLTGDGANPTPASQNCPQRQTPNSGETEHSALHRMQSKALSEAQAQVKQTNEQISVLSKKLAAWESWYAKQPPKSDDSPQKKRTFTERKNQTDTILSKDNAKPRAPRSHPKDTTTISFPEDLTWPVCDGDGKPTPYGLPNYPHNRATPRAFSERKEKNHGHRKTEADYAAYSNIHFTDALAGFHPHRASDETSMHIEPLVLVEENISELDRNVMELIAKKRAIRELSSEGQKLAEARLRAVLLAERRRANLSYVNRDEDNESVSTGNLSNNEGIDSQCISKPPIEIYLSTSND